MIKCKVLIDHPTIMAKGNVITRITVGGKNIKGWVSIVFPEVDVDEPTSYASNEMKHQVYNDKPVTIGTKTFTTEAEMLVYKLTQPEYVTMKIVEGEK